jgi:ACR3 family arsenite efflux pump ArsB
LSVVAAPKLATGNLDAATQEVMVNSLLVVIILAVVPWRYVWQQYVTAKGDRWR